MIWHARAEKILIELGNLYVGSFEIIYLEKNSFMTIDPKYKPILLEALEDMMYKLSIQLEPLKGKPLTAERKQLTAKQNLTEELQHIVSNSLE